MPIWGIKDVQQAKTALGEAVKLNPNWNEARLLLADINLKTGGFDLAIEGAQEILKKDSGSIQARLILGSAYLGKKDPVRANKAFEEVVKIAPNNPLGYYQMGVVAHDSKERWGGRKPL